MTVLAPPPPQDALELLIREAQARQHRRRIQVAAGVLAAAGLALAVWAAVPGRAGSVIHRYRGPIEATVTSKIAPAGIHLGISYIGTGGGVTWATNSPYDAHAYWLTNNGGRSWHRLRFPDHVSGVNPNGIRFVDRQHGWVSFGYRVYRTTDGGRTWQSSVSGLRCLAPRCGGIDWISFSDSRHGLAVVDVLSPQPSELFRTDDGGTTWQLLSRPQAGGYWATALTGRDGFAGIDTGAPIGPYNGPLVGALLRTADGGSTWSEYEIAGSNSWIELPIASFGRRVIVVQNGPNPAGGGMNLAAGTVWSGSADGSRWDGAAVPSQIGQPTSFSLASPRFWALSPVTENDLYVTTTAGHSWRRIVLRGIPRPPSGETGSAIGGLAFTSPRLGWAIVHAKLPGVTGRQTLVRTTDGGLHWTVNGPVGHQRHARPKADKRG